MQSLSPITDREITNIESGVPGMTFGGGALPLALWRKQTQPIAVHTKLVRRGYKQPTMVAKFTMIRNEGKQSLQCHLFAVIEVDVNEAVQSKCARTCGENKHLAPSTAVLTPTAYTCKNIGELNDGDLDSIISHPCLDTEVELPPL